MFFTVTNRDGQATLSVISDSFEKIVASTHPNYAALVEYFATTPEDQHDEDYVRGLVDPTIGIGNALREAFGDRLTFDLHHLYLDGLKVSGPLASLIKERLTSADQDWMRFAKFLINLDRNPSYKAQQAVFEWVQANGLTVTEDGRFLGYKAVREDGLSSSSGPNNFVNGELINNGETCRVPHEIGSVISKKRADVDDTPGGGCSVGLHVGTLEYASGFAPRLMTVAVDPADVVSAPDRNLEYKIRVCRYEVISLADPKQFASTSYDLQPKPEVEDATEADVTVGDAPTPWKVVEYDNLGVTVLESFETEDAAQEALDGYVEDEPEGDFEVQYHDPDTGEIADGPEDADQMTIEDVEVEDDEVETEESLEQDANEGNPSLTLAQNAELLPDLKADLEDTKFGHKPLAAKWSHLTTEASVRRYRKSQGIGLSLLTKIKG